LATTKDGGGGEEMGARGGTGGVRLGIDGKTSAATAAENKPHYDFQVGLGGDMMVIYARTYKYEKLIGILFQLCSPLLILLLQGSYVHGEERTRTIREIMFSLQLSIFKLSRPTITYDR
jgi:hypothetical protein